MIDILRSQARTVEGYVSAAIGYLNPIWYTFRQYSHTFTSITDLGVNGIRVFLPSTAGMVTGQKVRISGGSYDGTQVGTITAISVNVSIDITGVTFRGTASGFLVNLSAFRNLGVESELLDPVTGLSISKATSTWASKPDLTGTIDVQSEIRSLFYSKREVPFVTVYGVILKNITTGTFKLRYRETYLDTSNVVQKGSWITIAEDCVAVPARKQIQETYGNNLIDFSIKNQITKQVLFNPDFSAGLDSWDTFASSADDVPWDDARPSFLTARCKVTNDEQFLDPGCDETIATNYLQAGAGSGFNNISGAFQVVIPAGGSSASIQNKKQVIPVNRVFWAAVQLTGISSTGNALTVHLGRYNAAGTLLAPISSHPFTDNNVLFLTIGFFVPTSTEYFGLYVTNAGGTSSTVTLEVFARVKRSAALSQTAKLGGSFSGAKSVIINAQERLGELVTALQLWGSDTADVYPGNVLYQNQTPTIAIPSPIAVTFATARQRLGAVVFSNVDYPINYLNVAGLPGGQFLTRFKRLRKWKGVPRTIGYLFDGVLSFGPQLQLYQYAFSKGVRTTIRVATQSVTSADVGVYQFVLADDPNAEYYGFDIYSPSAGAFLIQSNLLMDSLDLCKPSVVLEWQNSLGGFDQWAFKRRIDLSLAPGEVSPSTERYDPDIEISKGNLDRDSVDSQITLSLYDDFVPTGDVLALDGLKKSKSVKIIFPSGNIVYVVPVIETTTINVRARYTKVSVTVQLPRNFDPTLIDPTL